MPETEYKGKHICVTGKIAEYRGAPEIVADAPKQIRIDAEK
jgi:DNA/RNA endonuclease YhcR with UshA esterase domain